MADWKQIELACGENTVATDNVWGLMERVVAPFAE